ncbi:UNVERIFIED_CONTAM: hypothetical protein Slati_0802200 [Sesamum latifolium]|uniref:Small ribosomal subunit protein mS41 SAM domain-containing protein n=1 Tax=Sesamum latifolium TaxID=2727402 RepID=A0AAW2XKV2_9LAMI
MAWRQILTWSRRLSSVPEHSNPVSGIAKFSSKSGHYVVKVGIPEFLSGVGKGLEKHVEKLESEIGGLEKLLVTRTIKLKRLGIPCQDVRKADSLYVMGDINWMSLESRDVQFRISGVVWCSIVTQCGGSACVFLHEF